MVPSGFFAVIASGTSIDRRRRRPGRQASRPSAQVPSTRTPSWADSDCAGPTTRQGQVRPKVSCAPPGVVTSSCGCTPTEALDPPASNVVSRALFTA
jgi:hypothetical protein